MAAVWAGVPPRPGERRAPQPDDHHALHAQTRWHRQHSEEDPAEEGPLSIIKVSMQNFTFVEEFDLKIL